MTTYAIRPKTYHGREGFHIGSRGNGGWPVSIFVQRREDAELIRGALNADRALAVEHREDDQPCGCDDCMSYGAEDEGFDWYRLRPERRIALRVLDSGDDRLAPLAQTICEHEEAEGEQP